MKESSNLLSIEYLPVGSLKPYDKNARVHDAEDVEALKQSIRDYGFSDPIGVWGPENLIVEGHGRLEAAKSLGLEQVPVIHLDHLSDEEQKAYRLAHNRTAELSFWDKKLGKQELGTISALNMSAFRFFSENDRQKAWGHVQKLCNLKKNLSTFRMTDMLVTGFFKTGSNGRPLEEIKQSREVAGEIARILCDQLLGMFGAALAGNRAEWALVTTPRRHHAGPGEYHFATDICVQAAEQLDLTFYPDLVTAHNLDKLNPDFRLEREPEEPNLILFDDVVTTGQTLRMTRNLLIAAGHVVLPIVAIKNL